MTIKSLEEDFDARTRLILIWCSRAFIIALLLFVLWGLSNLYALEAFDGKYWAIFATWSGWRFLLGGVVNSLKIAGVDLVLAIVIGLMAAMAQLSSHRSLRYIGIGYVEFFRGIPTLLLILVFYFGGNVEPFWAVVWGSALYNSAVLSNILKAGVLSLGRGQAEASYSLGFGHLQTMRYVTIMQAISRMLPSIFAQFVMLLKDSSLGFFIGYEELLRRSQIISSYEHNYLQAYFVAGVLYFVLCYVVSRIGSWLESHL